MKSLANYKSHPIHAALIPLPLAFLSGAFFFDLVGIVAGRAGWWTTGGNLMIVGVVAALIVAIPGAVDYFGSVPPKSSAKERATKHALVNLGATGLFAAAWWLRGGSEVAPTAALIAIEAVGFGLLLSGGWMGGTLVYRNQIGVDHRYAGAGRWSRERVRPERNEPVTVARADELEPDQMKLIEVKGERIVLARTVDDWVAFEDHCPHRGGVSGRRRARARSRPVPLARLAVRRHLGRSPGWPGRGGAADVRGGGRGRRGASHPLRSRSASYPKKWPEGTYGLLPA